MKNPHLSEQPSKMYDKFYIDPTSMIDYGGVHINSGIPNYCFYLISQHINKFKTLQLFIECLYKLSRYSNFYIFSEQLLNISYDKNIYYALYEVGLISYTNNKYPILLDYSNTDTVIMSHNMDDIVPSHNSSKDNVDGNDEPNSKDNLSSVHNINTVINTKFNLENINNNINKSKIYIQPLSTIYIPVLSTDIDNNNNIVLVPYNLNNK
jgi:hypothetical protein